MRRFPDSVLKEFSEARAIFKKLDSPLKIQNFLDLLRINFEETTETCHSPLLVLERKKAHCMEGALLAAAILWYHGERPLLLDLKTNNDDDDHVVALFKRENQWGAISKTNHAVLRYRDPVYASARELAMSYFNEYFLDDGVKTLRSYSKPFDLLRFGNDWLTTKKNLWNVTDALDNSPHINILPKVGVRHLRLADPIEIKAGKLTQWKKKPSR